MSIPGFSYDTLDRLIEEIGFDGRTQRYQYNEAGELIAREDANGQTNVHCRGGQHSELRHAYDLLGNRETTSPCDGTQPDRLAMRIGHACSLSVQKLRTGLPAQ